MFISCDIDQSKLDTFSSSFFSDGKSGVINELPQPAVRGVRSVWMYESAEMYQWKESKEEQTTQRGDKKEKVTIYHHTQTWSGQHEVCTHRDDTTQQMHTNPDMAYTAKKQVSANIYAGGYDIGQRYSVLTQTRSVTPNLSPNFGAAPPAVVSSETAEVRRLRGQETRETAADETAAIETAADETATIETAAVKLGSGAGEYMSYAVSGNYLYVMQHGSSTNYPQVGDYRVSYTVCASTHISIMAQQQGGKFVAWKNPVIKDYDVDWAYDGNMSSDDMIDRKNSENTAMTWGLRVLFLFTMWFGLLLMFGPLSVFPQFIPFIGRWLGEMIGCILGLLAFLMAISLTLITIAISWIAVRPMLGIGLLTLAFASLFCMWYLNRKSKNGASGVNGGGAQPFIPPPGQGQSFVPQGMAPQPYAPQNGVWPANNYAPQAPPSQQYNPYNQNAANPYANQAAAPQYAQPTQYNPQPYVPQGGYNPYGNAPPPQGVQVNVQYQ